MENIHIITDLPLSALCWGDYRVDIKSVSPEHVVKILSGPHTVHLGPLARHALQEFLHTVARADHLSKFSGLQAGIGETKYIGGYRYLIVSQSDKGDWTFTYADLSDSSDFFTRHKANTLHPIDRGYTDIRAKFREYGVSRGRRALYCNSPLWAALERMAVETKRPLSTDVAYQDALLICAPSDPFGTDRTSWVHPVAWPTVVELLRTTYGINVSAQPESASRGNP